MDREIVTTEDEEREDSNLHALIGIDVLYLLLAVCFIVAVVLAMMLATKPTTAEYNDLLAKYAALAGKQPTQTRRMDQPPIIRLAEAGGYRFPSGSADISDVFTEKIMDRVVPQIVALARTYDVNTVEVVGYTDGVPMRGRASNLDTQLPLYMSGESPVPPTAADNVGLGMARAAAVVRILMADPQRLKGLNIVPLSGGQTVLANGEAAQGADLLSADPDRRRIDIRLRRNTP